MIARMCPVDFYINPLGGFLLAHSDQKGSVSGLRIYMHALTLVEMQAFLWDVDRSYKDQFSVDAETGR